MKSHCPLATLVAVAITIPLLSIHPAFSAPEGLNGATDIAPQEWQQDKNLEIKVSAEAVNTSVPDFLTQLQKLTNVRFGVERSERINSLRLTACLNDVTLIDVMRALRRLYGVSWKKSDMGKFVLFEGKNTSFDVALLQLGDIDKLQQDQLTTSRARRTDIGRQIIQTVDSQLLHSKEGIPISTLPSSLRDNLKKELQDYARLRLLGTYAKAVDISIENNFLSTRVAGSGTPKINEEFLQFSVVTPLGITLSPIGRIPLSSVRRESLKPPKNALPE